MSMPSRRSTGATKVTVGRGHQHPSRLFSTRKRAVYRTSQGAMYCGDSRELMKSLPDDSVDLVVTSPPYALHFKKAYGNVDKVDYVDWFRDFGDQIFRVLKPTGSFVLNIGGSYNAGSPTRSLYHFHLLLMLCEEIGFSLAQECFWYNPAKLPSLPNGSMYAAYASRTQSSMSFGCPSSMRLRPTIATSLLTTVRICSASSRKGIDPRIDLADTGSPGSFGRTKVGRFLPICLTTPSHGTWSRLRICCDVAITKAIPTILGARLRLGRRFTQLASRRLYRSSSSSS